MSNFNNVNVSNPPASPSLGSDPADLESLRARLRKESQERFNEESSEPMLPREN